MNNETAERRKRMVKCPYCGEAYILTRVRSEQLTPPHDFPMPYGSVCPGSVHPLIALDDPRPLGKDAR
jgi:hypothetical protein